MKLPKGVYQRNKASPQLWVTYLDENGKQIKESAHTTDSEIAEAFRNKRLNQVSELVSLIEQCQKQNDLELQAFILLAACTGLRKGAIMSRKWDEVRVDDEYPYIYMPKKDSKNKRQSRLPLPGLVILALRQLPSYKTHEYLFPARPNVRFNDVEKFKKPHAWDLGKRFKRACTLAGINNLRIHDLRHFATTMLLEVTQLG